MKNVTLPSVLAVAVFLLGGCPPENYDQLAPATMRVIDRIRNDDDLSAPEKRAQLEALGLDPVVINALLKDERLANQYGGDLRTAYRKVTEPDLRKLTPDEVQVYADEASKVDNTVNLSLTDEQAQAIVDLLRREDLISSADVAEFMENPDNEIPSVIPDGALRRLFVDFDPERLLPNLP